MLIFSLLKFLQLSVEQRKSFIFGGCYSQKSIKFAAIIISLTSYYIVSFNFLCRAMKKFHFSGSSCQI